MRTLLAALAFCTLAAAQTAPANLQSQAKAAYGSEMARDKAGDCPNANNTREIVDCLSHEVTVTEANFQQFTNALRALLGSEQRQEFDTVQTAWNAYFKAQCQAAYNLNKGGTIAPVNQTGCELLLVRSRMRELNAIYDAPLHL